MRFFSSAQFTAITSAWLSCHMQGFWSLSLLHRDLHNPGELSRPPLLSALPVRWPVVPQLHKYRAWGRSPVVFHHLRLWQRRALGLLSCKEWVSRCLFRTVNHQWTTISSPPTVHFTVLLPLSPRSNGLLISFPHCQAVAVRHSGIPTHWQTAVTSLTSRPRCHGARLGSVASSRGQTC